jgi:hypothetical protein
MRNLSLGIFLITYTASAQLVSFGVKGGVELTSRPNYHDITPWFLVGPSLEFRLPAHFAVEVSALYSRIGSDYAFNFTDGIATTSVKGRARGNSFEFPILGKYYFGGERKRTRAFVGTGYSFRTVWFKDQSSYSSSANLQNAVPGSSSSRGPLEVGALASAGVRVRAGRVYVTPELRYVRWGARDAFGHKDEAKMLVGLSF